MSSKNLRAAEGPVEKRTFTCDSLTIEKRDDTSEAPMIRGHAAVFNSPAQIGSFREQIEPGAFTDAIKNDDVRALFNHDPNIVLGRNKAGTLRMVEDKKGLAIEIDPPDTQAARDLMTSIKRGDISQMSFGFSVMSQQWDEDAKTGEVTRTIKAVQLYDVSPVTYPAYTDTDVAVRAFDAYREEHPRAEPDEGIGEGLGLLETQRRRVELAEKS